MAYIGKQPVVGNFQVCDAISVVNGQAAYTMQVGSTNVEPENANHMLVSLNGVLQKPGSSFTISGATITFASNLATGDVIDFIILLGNVLDLGVPSDATVSTAKIVDGAVTSAKLDSGVALGKVLQVVTATDSTQRTTTSTTYVTASNTLSVNITPSSTSSKIFIIVTSAMGTPGSGAQGIATIFRDSTNLEGSLGNGLARQGSSLGASFDMSILDSPNTTSQVTYQVYIRETSAVSSLSINWSSSTGSITAFEIGA